MNNIAGLSALKAYGVRQQVNANNIANVNTPNFNPSRTTMEEAPDRSGVRVQEIKKQGDELRIQKNENLLRTAREDEVQKNQKEEPSRTDLVTEFTQVIENKNVYNANAQAIKVNDQMTGEIVNKLV